jgi:hypothetical protein
VADFSIKRNDTRPVLDLICERAGPFNLTGYSCVAIMTLASGGAPKINRQPITIDDAANGLVSYTFDAAETDTEGVYNFEVEATNGAQIITFPTEGFFTVEVWEDLG